MLHWKEKNVAIFLTFFGAICLLLQLGCIVSVAVYGGVHSDSFSADGFPCSSVGFILVVSQQAGSPAVQSGVHSGGFSADGFPC